jgi:CelD/BcsL family acetyltransferase involved in cellulose biosynthesis
LSKRARKQLRRELKLIEEQGGILEMVTDPDQVVDLLEDVMSLHQLRYDDEVFATPERRRFHLAAAQRMSEAGRARIARLRIGDANAALLYLLNWKSTVYFYSSGLRPELGRTPGFALRAWAVTQVAEEGFTIADFLRGDYEWKQRLADGELHATRVRVVRVTPRVVTTGIRRVLRRRHDVEVH